MVEAMRRITPIIITEDDENYSMLYFALSGNDVIAMFQTVSKSEIKDPTPENILRYFQMYGEDMEVPLKTLNDVFSGDKIIAFIKYEDLKP